MSRLVLSVARSVIIGLMLQSSVWAAGPPQETKSADAASKIHPALSQRTQDAAGRIKAWVFFSDKGLTAAGELESEISRVAAGYSRRAVERRMKRGVRSPSGGLFDFHDLPICQAYRDGVEETGARVHVVSKWLNAVSVKATPEQLEAIAALDFVKKLQPVARTTYRPLPESSSVESDPEVVPVRVLGGRSVDYGNSQSQLLQMNLIALHEEGYTGQGVIIGILDSGFKVSHEAYNYAGHSLNVIAEWDFINDDGNTGVETGDPSSQHDHGTKTLSCIGAYKPGSLVGGAFDASFILCKTEDTSGEYQGEEDNYVAGLEFIEQHGGDMATSSLGYIDWYTQADLDGLTAVTTIAVNIATGKGMHCCTAAGNEYHDSNPTTSSIIAPADAFQVITCGAVDSSGNIASFSSDGPTADGRVKPEILARGVSANVVSSSSDTSYTVADGTSFSTPLIASAVACLIQARPYWTVDQMREHLFETASYYTTYGTHDPYYVKGYGIINAFGAYSLCSDAGVVAMDRSKYRFDDVINITASDCGLNTDDGVVEQVTVSITSTTEAVPEQVVLEETDASSAEFIGNISTAKADAPGVLQVSAGDTVTVTYIDSDDGQGGTNVVVTDTATIDVDLPTVSLVQTLDITPRSAKVAVNADEPVRGTVHYGTSCALLPDTAITTNYSLNPTVVLNSLDPQESYYYVVEVADEAGNVTTMNNGGVCYSFSTPAVPNFFTELFETASPNDLEETQLVFTPNGTYDYYSGCVEQHILSLPTDPSTGTVLSLTDDSFATITLTGGKTIPFYGSNYSEFFPVSNGYLTFVSGVTDYSETLDEHFSGVPKICALYDDLNPADGGTISWEQFSDRVVVTWDSVPQHSTSGDSNTFQIEMFFDGTITISYLEIGAVDGLAGLSRGEGMDPDFEETDLSAMSDCGPQRPLAFDDNVSLPANGSLSIELPGRDDGLPDPPAAVDYIITALPSHGDLSDPGSGAITAVPYILASNGNVVDYTPEEDYYGSDSLKFKLNDGGVAPDGGDSDEATISIGVIANPPTTQNVSVDLDMNGSATVHLLGNDIDGDDLDYTIMSLPQHGVLSDPSGGAITSTPYTLLGGGEDVLYTAEADYAGADVFMYYASDEIFNSTASTVSLQVIAPAPVITTSVLADGLVSESYGPVQLEVSGGQPTVQWQLVTEQIYAETDLGQSNFGEVGVAKGWHKDEGFWYYFMPFAFPFYGEEYSLIRIRPNGFIDFGSFDGSASENSVTSLINNRMIALLWDDLKTTGTGEDMFIDESVSGSVTIRWRASTYAGDSALNISLTLVDDGTIYFDYGSGNTNVAATVGVSDGDGVHYTVGSYDGLTDLGGLNSVRFHVPLLLPGGMGLSSTGVLSGVPAETGDFEPVFKVTDSLGRSDQKVIALHITDFVAGDCDYDGDGDVDLADYAGFQSCYGDTGSPACSMFHSNDDGVIDLVDFAAFAEKM